MTGYCLNSNLLYFDILMTTLRRVINCSSHIYPLHIFTEKCILSSFDSKNFNRLHFFVTLALVKVFRALKLDRTESLEAKRASARLDGRKRVAIYDGTFP